MVGRQKTEDGRNLQFRLPSSDFKPLKTKGGLEAKAKCTNLPAAGRSA